MGSCRGQQPTGIDQQQQAEAAAAELRQQMLQLQSANRELAAANQAVQGQAAASQAETLRLREQVDGLRAQMHQQRDRPDLQRQFKEVEPSNSVLQAAPAS